MKPARLIAAIGVLVLAGIVVRDALVSEPAVVAAGRPAPAFSGVTLASVPMRRTLADYAGAPLLVNVWATWCDPCREEMPSIQRLYEEYRDRGLRVVALSVDDRGSEGLLREFVAEYGLTFDILHDATASALQQFAVRGVPETFLISRSGVIVASRLVEDWTAPHNRALVDSLLTIGARE